MEVTRLFQTVVAGGFCVGCGACTAVKNSLTSIELDEYGRFCATLDIGSSLSKIDAKVLSVCPFSDQSLNENEIGKELYGGKAAFDNRIGYHLSTYAGFVSEMDFCARGSSGGMGKWILYELFRKNLVDKVIQVEQNMPTDSDRFLYRYRVANSVSKIKSGSKSVYYPVEMSEVLRHVREHASRYAIVGLPCFIKAIRLLSAREPVFRERIRFCIGLICGHLKSTKYAEMIAWQYGVAPGNLVSIDFRNKLPDRKANEKGIKVIGFRKNKKINRVDVVQKFFGTNYNHGFFKYQACDFCDDVVAETADISVGDAWLPEYLEDGRGTNVLIVRHPMIQRLIEQGISSGRLRLERINPGRVVKSQKASFRHRREGLAYRLFLKDTAGLWHPPKRVKAQRDHLNRERRKIYKFRVKMARNSYKAFENAVKTGSFSVFQEEMEAMLSKYACLYRPSLWRRTLSRALRTLKPSISRSPKIVEIHGAGFQNKGAELMLRTVVSELGQRLSRFVPTIDPGYGLYRSRCKLGLLQMFPRRSHVGTPGFSGRFRRQKLFALLGGERLFRYIGSSRLSNYGCVSLSDVQGLIDIAGFAYTDQWGSQTTIDFSELTHYYKSRNKPVILLPQAFGPFHKEETKSAFRKVVDNASLIFARDRKSYEYAIELSPDSNKILQAPDITLFYPDSSNNKMHVRSDYACVVPNIRLLDQGKQQWAEKYKVYLTRIVREILRRGVQVRIVVYDTSGQDLQIARSIIEKVASSCVTIVNEQDSVSLKQMISRSLLLVGSRYHSLVAAFSNKVPAIALGWAHKYEMLFEDFGCEQLLISSETPIDAVLECVTDLIDEDMNMSHRHQIAERLQRMRSTNQEMWNRVVEVLTSTVSP